MPLIPDEVRCPLLSSKLDGKTIGFGGRDGCPMEVDGVSSSWRNFASIFAILSRVLESDPDEHDVDHMTRTLF